MNVNTHLEKNIEKHEAFHASKKPGMLFFSDLGFRNFKDIGSLGFDFPKNSRTYGLSMEKIANNAYELGKLDMQVSRNVMKFHSIIEDDFHPMLVLNWGTGVTAGYISGSVDVKFHQNTSFAKGQFIEDLDDVENLIFPEKNMWMEYVGNYWRGVESEWEGEKISVSNHFRSPLDVANELRGNDFFYDLYDDPDMLKLLISKITDKTIMLDKYWRNESKFLREAPGGTWGAVSKNNVTFVNGDPIDLIMPDFIEEFNNQYIERLVNELDKVFFHHHSIGYEKAPEVAKIKGLWVQQISQDPNGAVLRDLPQEQIDILAKTSMDCCPLMMQQFNMKKEGEPLEKTLDKYKNGRFMMTLKGETIEETKRLLDRARNYCDKF